MKAFLLTVALSAGLGMVVAQAQTAAPVTATCKDGTTFSGKKRSGACRGHGGVEAFDTTPSTTTPAATPATPAATQPAPVPAPTPSVTASRPQTQSAPQSQSGTTAPPPGNGQVWVNTASHVYHCPGTQWYGKTKKGEYMTEAAAKSDGDRPDHGKSCS